MALLESAWLFVGVISILATGVAVATQTELLGASTNADGIAILSGIVGFVSWGVWTFGTLDVRVVGDSVTYTFSMPPLTFLGIVLMLVPGWIALTGPIEIASRYKQPESKEV